MSDKKELKLTPSIQKFILNWSRIASVWGMNRTVAQIHALLLVSPEPLTADQIRAVLQSARSNISVSLRLLENLGLIESVHVMGERKKHFEALKDIKQMFKRIMGVRKKKEVETTRKSLHEVANLTGKDPLDRKMNAQLNEINGVFSKLDALYEKLIDDI